MAVLESDTWAAKRRNVRVGSGLVRGQGWACARCEQGHERQQWKGDGLSPTSARIHGDLLRRSLWWSCTARLDGEAAGGAEGGSGSAGFKRTRRITGRA